MQKFLTCLTACLMVLCILSLAVQAYAFSTEVAPVQTDGTAKFADPDETMPNLVMAPQPGSAGLVPLSQPGQQVTMPTMGTNDQGSAAFDHAYNHLQDR